MQLSINSEMLKQGYVLGLATSLIAAISFFLCAMGYKMISDIDQPYRCIEMLTEMGVGPTSLDMEGTTIRPAGEV